MAQVVLSPIGQPLCAWTRGSRKYAIYVHPDVLARLGMEVRVAFKRVPRRGLEVGGILLGRTDSRDDTTRFWIEGFESIDSEHRSGPSYILSEPDFALLREALTKNGAASIGIYRSQTRSQQLELQEPDIKLLERCFDSGDVLFLIACPAAARAAFFIREHGEMKCVYEFDLGTPLAPSVAAQNRDSPESNAPEVDHLVQRPAEMQTALLAISRPIHPAEKEDAASEAVQFSDPRSSPGSGMEGRAINPELVKPAGGRRLRRVTWLVATLIFSAVLGAGIGALSRSRPRAVTPQRPPTEELHLTVEGNGGLLRLHWDASSPVLRNPSRAVLRIQDGEYQMVRNLAPSEFKAGSVTYEPRSRDVSFRVEVFSPTANASGVVQVVNLSPPPALTAVRPPEPIQPPAKYPAPEWPRSKPAPAQSQATAGVPVAKEPEKTAKQEIPPAVKSSEGSDAASVSKRADSPAIEFDKQPQPSIAERPAVPISVPEPSVQVWTEAVPGSAWGHLVGKVPLMGKVPLVRRLGKSAKASPPAPIFQAQPFLANSTKQSITQPVSVDVRVDVGVSGMVDRAEVIAFSDPFNGALVNSALAAAVRWTFEPARAEHLAVSSKVILHFRFTP